MSDSYLTPNVYLKEEALLPPSIPQVSTAIPGFIGYTQRVNENCLNKPKRISSLHEYENLFGGGDITNINVTLTSDNKVSKVEADPLKFLLHYSLRLFFANGGGACYVVSVGDYSAGVELNKLTVGVDALSKEDEPTLLVCPDATLLSNSDHFTFCKLMLDQSSALKDRFAIFDVQCSNKNKSDDAANISGFRQISGELKYGAAYYPYLQTVFPYLYTEDSITVITAGGTVQPKADKNNYEGIFNDLLKFSFQGAANLKPIVNISKDPVQKTLSITRNKDSNTLTITLPESDVLVSDVVAAFKAKRITGFDVTVIGGKDSEKIAVSESTSLELTTKTSSSSSSSAGSQSAKLSTYKTTNTTLYNLVRTAVEKQRVVLPASAAVAGIYAQVDNQQGVWKAPANVGISSVVGPTVKLSDQDQDDLNVDTLAGKSINAIRSFTGKGTLVWGARTLAGNDNEWRYVSVRRLFIMIEESVRKATAFAVFEPNVAMTWLKVKTAIESYLNNLWRQGALAGATAEQAYFVEVGLNKTMSQDDILNGRMIVKIGIAAVRPAEFIILTFSHKLQEA